MLATRSEIKAAKPTGSGVLVTLAPRVTTPPLGTAVVLPVLASLPGGFVGLVSTISADGKLTLRPAGLSAAFQYYDLNVDNITGPAVRLKPPPVPSSKGTSSPHPAKESCLDVHPRAAITFRPSVRLGGSFHAKIDTGFLHVPAGVSLRTALTATVTGSMSVDTSASVSCESPFKPIIKVLAADPVPISIVFSPDAEITATAGVQISNLGATVTGGVKLSVSLGLSGGASFSGRDILTATPSTPDVTANGSVGLTVGGQIIVGPGAGTPHAGVIAGLSGALDPLDASFGTASPHDANSCLKASAALTMGLSLKAKAWLDDWSIDRTISFSLLSFTGDYPGSPWYFPASASCRAQNPELTGTLSLAGRRPGRQGDRVGRTAAGEILHPGRPAVIASSNHVGRFAHLRPGSLD
jgi:hypothetical protein